MNILGDGEKETVKPEGIGTTNYLLASEKEETILL